MLLVLYGTTLQVGEYSRDFFEKKGFDIIKKYSCNSDIVDTKDRFGSRIIVSESDFYKFTDSLFRYDNNGVLIGFNKNQIFDAVCNRTNAVMTISAPNLSFIKKIKKVHGENVLVVYCYIGDKTLKKMIKSFSNLSGEEAKYRFLKEKNVKEQYIKNSNLFDRVVIFDEDDDKFNYNNLGVQYNIILESFKKIDEDSKIEAYDVFISYARSDIKIVKNIINKLETKNISVFRGLETELEMDWNTILYKTLLSAKAIVIIITENTVKSNFVLEGIKTAVDTADKSATLIVPVFLGRDFEIEKSEVLLRLSTLSGVIADESEIDLIPDMVSERLERLFDGEKKLKTLSEQVKNYIDSDMLEEAVKFQRQHLDLCNELTDISNGTLVGEEVIASSQIKLINILKKLEKWDDALNEIVAFWSNAYSDCIENSFYSSLCDSFGECCVGKDMTEEQVKDFIAKYINKTPVYDNSEMCNDYFEKYIEIKSRGPKSKFVYMGVVEDNRTNKIANNGKNAMRLFEEIYEDHLSNKSRTSIIEGYKRILNYCILSGIKNSVPKTCIQRISELREKDIPDSNSYDIIKDLKIYLGQALPDSGDYDVFISYKSEDEKLAEKVYEYLIENGKEVFFSKKTLTEHGDSKYKKVIFNALDRSKHLVLVGSDPEYFKTEWVSNEWSYYLKLQNNDNTPGNLVIILPDEYKSRKGHDKLPEKLNDDIEIIGTSEFRLRLLSYLW